MCVNIQRSLFSVKAMDCAAEANLIKMHLDNIEAIKTLEVNISDKTVAAYHDGSIDIITSALDSLGLGVKHIETTHVNHSGIEPSDQRRLLWTVLLINACFFVLEMTTGVIAQSMALVADSLDMLADSLVYGMALLAVGAGIARKKAVAKWSGYFQLVLACVGLIEVARRFFGFDLLPDYRIMIVVSILAIVANTVCLYLLRKSEDQDVHMQASMIFTSNDIIINFGVVAAGILVIWLNSNLPDLIIGLIVFSIVTRGALRILKLAGNNDSLRSDAKKNR